MKEDPLKKTTDFYDKIYDCVTTFDNRTVVVPNGKLSGLITLKTGSDE